MILLVLLISQLAHVVPGRSPEGLLKVLMSGTYGGPSADSQGTNTIIDDLMKKLFCRCNSPCITHLFWFLQEEQILKGSSWGRPRDVCGTQLQDFRRPNHGTFWGRPRDVGHTCFLN